MTQGHILTAFKTNKPKMELVIWKDIIANFPYEIILNIIILNWINEH